MRSQEHGYRHIVDVDGMLLGFEEPIVRVATLLDRANAAGERHLVQICNEESPIFKREQSVRLSENELVVFRSVPTDLRW